MIAKGTPHSNGARLGAYLVTGKDGERAELYELRGFAEADIVSAFRSEHVIAEGTHCEQPFFHCQVRNPAGEHLTRAQWQKVAAKIESKLGLTDQPRAIAFHSKDGHEHMHVAWSRIDHDKLKAKPLPFYKLRLKEVCREIEAQLSLTPVRNQREQSEPRAPRRAERDQSRRLGVDVERTRKTIRQAWTRSDCGLAFTAALAAEGMTLCQGDKRDYVVLDQEGGIHALGKRLVDATAAETRVRLADLDRGQLPTIEAAREGLACKIPHHELKDLDQEEARQQGHAATATDSGSMVAQNAEANRRHLELNPFLRANRGEAHREAGDAAAQLDRYMSDPEFRRQVNQQAQDEALGRAPPGHERDR